MLFCDLAGSERIAKSGVDGLEKAQAIGINGSLTALGRVIRALGDGTHVPWRDSSITKLLRGSFSSASTHNTVVVCVASEPAHIEETICSLEFGRRVATTRRRVREERGEERSRATIERDILIAERDLRQMRERGMGGHYHDLAQPSEVRGHRENVAKRDAARAAEKQFKIRALEAAAGGKGEHVPALKVKAAEHKFEADNVRDIIERQETIPDFWIKPTSVYVRKAAELARLEGELLVA